MSWAVYAGVFAVVEVRVPHVGRTIGEGPQRRMRIEGVFLLPTGGVPEADTAVPTSGRQPPTVRTPGDGVDVFVV